MLDIIGVVQTVHDKVMYTQDEIEKSHLPLTITDGRFVLCYVFM